MKNTITVLLFFILMHALELQGSDTISPPPIEPFSNIDRPTEQTQTIESVLSFLPEILVTYGTDSKIFKSRLIGEMGMGLNMAIQQGQELSQSKILSIVQKLIDAMINLDMMVSLAEDGGLAILNEDTEQELNKLKGELGELEFYSMLKMQGMTEEKFRNRIGKKVLIDKWMEEKIKPKMIVTDVDIKDFYLSNLSLFKTKESISISHILLKKKFQKDDNAETIKTLGKIKHKLMVGMDFSELASQFSQCSIADKNGNLGTFTEDSFVSALAGPIPKNVFSLGIQEVSDPIETNEGFHLIKVIGRKKAKVYELSEMLKSKIKLQLEQTKINDYMRVKQLQWRHDNSVTLLF